MATKRIELELVYGNYSVIKPSGHRLFLCGNTLAKYFDLEDKPKEITVVISSHPSKNSYFVQVHKICYQATLILLSSGQIAEVVIYSGAHRILRNYPKGCYVSIEA